MINNVYVSMQRICFIHLEGEKMKKWCHKINISATTLEPELNAFSEQGWNIEKIWKVTYDNYEVIASKEDLTNSTDRG